MHVSNLEGSLPHRLRAQCYGGTDGNHNQGCRLRSDRLGLAVRLEGGNHSISLASSKSAESYLKTRFTIILSGSSMPSSSFAALFLRCSRSGFLAMAMTLCAILVGSSSLSTRP